MAYRLLKYIYPLDKGVQATENNIIIEKSKGVKSIGSEEGYSVFEVEF